MNKKCEYRKYHVIRHLQRHMNSIKNLDSTDWVVRNPKKYLEQLNEEYETLLEETYDMIFLLNEATNQKFEVLYENNPIIEHARKFKFVNFLCSDFEYIQKLEFLLQDSIPKVDFEKSYYQLAILGQALANLVNAIVLVKDYVETLRIIIKDFKD